MAMHALTEAEAPKPRGTMVDVGGGKAYLSLPRAKAPVPGVIVVHEWWGLNAHIKHWADRLAEDGYAALAVDLYGGIVAKTPAEAMATMKSVKEADARAMLAAAYAFLGEDSRTRSDRRAIMGWCFGGGWSLQHALKEPGLHAAIIYYGRTPTDPDVLRAIKAPVLGIFATRDKGIPNSQVDAFEKGLQQAGVRHTIARYDAEHAFANPSQPIYQKQAAADAWQKARSFLRQHLVPQPTRGE